jgi:aminopeptidase N
MLDTPLDSGAPGGAGPTVTRRADYQPPAFLVDSVALTFDLDPAATLVRSRLTLRRKPDAADPQAPLFLNGESLTLLSAAIDGEPLDASRLVLMDGNLVLADVPDAFELELQVRIAPDRNTELSGLYLSGGNFFTQCEAEGFRRITFFPDRPDVMARFTTTIVAARDLAPVLLSNGNPVDAGETADGRHWAKWEDPHPKPAYLFALVAGDLVAVRDQFITASNRTVALAIYVRAADRDKCSHAMDSLKQSMRWDEDIFGLEYDLDVFNIAAVSDFNMGAMENKGLNVFNTKYVLARPETATDGDYQGIETVIAHEYFHNWTGNRVTCRDWFQLSLKEGLTVFRDQEFSADQGSPAVKRIADVRRLRAAQFPEDEGPLAHPVRPDSYVRIDNFYTATIYEKGAELVRMIRTLIGRDGFRRGMDLYFARHDNHAVTIEDFVAAMADASGVDLSAFRAWYGQAGTPRVEAALAYDAPARRTTLVLRQSTKPTPGQPDKQPLPIPVAMGLIGPDGAAVPVRLAGEATGAGGRLLMLDQAEQSFVFEDTPAGTVPSLLRGFSAPVRLTGLPLDALRLLAAHDSDPFVRWDSGQQYTTARMLQMAGSYRQGAALTADPGLLEAARATLARAEADPALAAEALTLPGLDFVADQMPVADYQAVHHVRRFLRRAIGEALAVPLRAAYHRFADPGPYRHDGAAIGRRALRATCLDYLAAAGADGVALARAQFEARGNMTDVLGALVTLSGIDGPDRQAALDAFYAEWRDEELVLDKWFAINTMSTLPGAIGRVRALYRHPDFDLRTPNRVRSVVSAFAHGNPLHFHDASGEGYRFLADAILELDPINGQVAARLTSPFGAWHRQSPDRQVLMRAELARILAKPDLSQGTREVAERSAATS